jgi:hypothetical protein
VIAGLSSIDIAGQGRKRGSWGAGRDGSHEQGLRGRGLGSQQHRFLGLTGLALSRHGFTDAASAADSTASWA